MTTSLTADDLRSSFIDYFRARGHRPVPSASLIPTHPAAPLFTNSGMVQFLPIFFGEEPAAFPRAVTSQKCVRVRGKHDDIEEIGRTTRHLTFFEMLGNFSFGDYFKEGAIRYAWEYLTEVLEIDGDRLWATVHTSDDEAAEIWRDAIDMPRNRIQRLGEDNFWEMGATGPCGPSSEVFYDKGARWGPAGGPSDGGSERYVEIWNLVFMTFDRLADGTLERLPAKHIDTGAGLERILPILQDTQSVFDTDVLRRLLTSAEQLTGCHYGSDEDDDISLRIVADHARAATFLIADGVVPSNEERGYVVRRIIRRAARHARRVGARRPVMAAMAAAVADAMKTAYPEVHDRLDSISATLEREEEKFLDNLSLGMSMLDGILAEGGGDIPGPVAFKLHDTYGFPIDLTAEIARERGAFLDREGYDAAMTRQREQARGAVADHDVATDSARLRPIIGRGPTRFVGYERPTAEGTIVAVLDGIQPGRIEVFTDETPFYAESGGQIGDTGTIVGPSGVGRVVDTDRPVGGVIRHHVELESGQLREGDRVQLQIDADRRDAIRRSHTATHLLHWALRTALGTPVHQQGSLVAPDLLRFDFNHHSPLGKGELDRLEDLVADQVLTDSAVDVREMPLSEARAAGALMFFGEKYGEVVRVVSAGKESRELCGGTHVDSLGRIGEFVIRSEGSIGTNLRRLEALTGRAAHEESQRQRGVLRDAASRLRVPALDVPAAVEREQAQHQATERERRRLAGELDRVLARQLADEAVDGVVVARCDHRDQSALRELAAGLRSLPNIAAVGLVGSPDGSSVALAVAVDGGHDATAIVRRVASLVGGGGGGRNPRLAVGGGRDVSAIGAALDELRTELSA
jgi:alanyl-tRNA synthetase